MQTDKTVNVALVYNPFDVTNIVREELVYDDGKTLDHYLVGLPDDVDWKIGLNTIPIEKEDWAKTEVKPEDHIQIVCIPRGGRGGKQILRLVAMIALVVAASYFLGPGGLGLSGWVLSAAVAATVAIGGFLINMAIPIPAASIKSKDIADDGNSYGYDGAKNTSREGTPVPVVYGQFRVAGNFVDLYTENVGDDQYLYGRVVLSDGEIDGIDGEVEINEQSIANYKDVEWNYTLGSPSEAVNTRFNGAKQQFNRQDLLTTGWTQYDTTGNVDAFELDFVFPQGLATFDQKTGDKKSTNVTVEIQYATFGTTSWTNVGFTGDLTGGYQLFNTTSPTATKFRLFTQASGMAGIGATQTYQVEYKLVGDPGWTLYDTYTDESQSYSTYPDWDGDTVLYRRFDTGMPSSYGQIVEFPPRTINLELPSGQYQFRVTGSGALTGKAYVPPYTAPGSGGINAVTTVSYTDNRTKTLRKTYKSPDLPRGRYSIRFRRTTTESATSTIVDSINCSNVTEVQHSKVTLRNLATGWFVAKMTDQLSQIPTVTFPVRGVKVDIYDNNGNVTANAWSDNPADIVLDMLISERRGPLRNKITIDFPAFVQWRDYCTDQGLKFNGVFDSLTTLWDALQEVFKCGRAFPVRAGTRLSVGIDKPTKPVMLFGPGNIFKDSFQINYIGLQDRANEFEVSYYDKTDRNKKKTIRIVDPQSAQAGQIPKTVSYELAGVDNFDQAQKEVWYQLYNNRLARRVLTFDAPIESIGLTLGDVAYVQHDMVDWGDSGRLAGVGSSTQVQLDKNVTLSVGKTYSLLVIHDKVSKGTCSFTNTSGASYNLTAISAYDGEVEKMKRFQTNTGDEAEILDFLWTSTTTASVTLSKTVTGTTGTIWDVDVVEERSVTTGPGNTSTIQVSSAFSVLPQVYANYMFGETSLVKRPYRLRAISGDGFERRTLTFVEYNEYIYSDPETLVPAPAINRSVFPQHVKNCTFTTDPTRTGDTVLGFLSWRSHNILNYAGADIYISTDGSDYTFYATVMNSNNFTVHLRDGGNYSFKVNAFNSAGMRANVNTAPIASKVIRTSASTLVPPENVTWTYEKLALLASGTISWTLGNTADGRVSPFTRVQVRYEGTDEWLDLGITDQLRIYVTGVPAGFHEIQIRGEAGTGEQSDWVTEDFTVSTPTLVAPTIATDGTAVDHVINADGSADISLEWSWAGNAADIDGFEIIKYSSLSGTAYTLGTTPAAEGMDVLSPSRRAAILQGVPANQFYTFYVRAYKRVDSSFVTSGYLYSNAVKPTGFGENPYQPSTSVAFTGSIVGTLDVAHLNDWTYITGSGRPEDYANVSGLSDGNRVIFSKFEQGTQGWNNFDIAGGSQNLDIGTSVGKTYVHTSSTFTANSQAISIGQAGDLTTQPYHFTVTPGERLFASVMLGTVSNPANTTIVRIYYYNSSGTNIGNHDVSTTTGSDSFPTRRGGFTSGTVPAGAVYGILIVYILNGTGVTGNAQIYLSEPMVCSAAPFQTIFPAFTPGPSGENGAQQNYYVVGPNQNTVFHYDHLGTPDGGQFPRIYSFKLMKTNGQVTSGITWTYQISGGGANGFTNASGPQSMSGSGTGTLTLNSLENDSTITVNAFYDGKTTSTTFQLTRNQDLPPLNDTIAGTASGWGTFASASFVDISGAIAGTVPAGASSVTITGGFQVMPFAGTSGGWTIEGRIYRDISGTPTPIGPGAVSDTSFWFESDVSGNPATINFNITDTGLTAGTTYTWRVFMRETSGTRGHQILSGGIYITV